MRKGLVVGVVVMAATLGALALAACGARQSEPEAETVGPGAPKAPVTEASRQEGARPGQEPAPDNLTTHPPPTAAAMPTANLAPTATPSPSPSPTPTALPYFLSTGIYQSNESYVLTGILVSARNSTSEITLEIWTEDGTRQVRLGDLEGGISFWQEVGPDEYEPLGDGLGELFVSMAKSHSPVLIAFTDSALTKPHSVVLLRAGATLLYSPGKSASAEEAPTASNGYQFLSTAYVENPDATVSISGILEMFQEQVNGTHLVRLWTHDSTYELKLDLGSVKKVETEKLDGTVELVTDEADTLRSTSRRLGIVNFLFRDKSLREVLFILILDPVYTDPRYFSGRGSLP